MKLNDILDYFNIKIPQENCLIKNDHSLAFYYIDNKGNNITESYSFINDDNNINNIAKEIKNKILINGGKNIKVYKTESQCCEYAYDGVLGSKCRCSIRCGQYCNKLS